MYLLHCKNCGQTYSLKTSGHTHCGCEQTEGILTDGGKKVSFTGDPFFLQVDDQAFGMAIQDVLRDNTEQQLNLTMLPFNHPDFSPE